MAGTRAGGKAAAETNKKLHGPDFYKRIGAIGGKLGRTGGFASGVQCTNAHCPALSHLGRGHKIVQCAGFKGGRLSRRPKAVQ